MTISPIYDKKLNGYFFKGRFTENHCIYLRSDGQCTGSYGHRNGFSSLCPFKDTDLYHKCRISLIKINGMEV